MSNNENNNNNQEDPPVAAGDHGGNWEETAVNDGNTPARDGTVEPGLTPEGLKSNNNINTPVRSEWLSPAATTIMEIDAGAVKSMSNMEDWAMQVFGDDKLPDGMMTLFKELKVGEDVQLCFKSQGLKTGRKVLQFARMGTRQSMEMFAPSVWAHDSFCIFVCVIKSIGEGHVDIRTSKWTAQEKEKGLPLNKAPNNVKGTNGMFN